MEIIIKEEKHIVLNKGEAHIIKHCLEYCIHRIEKHKKCGLLEIVEPTATIEVLRRLNKATN